MWKVEITHYGVGSLAVHSCALQALWGESHRIDDIDGVPRTVCRSAPPRAGIDNTTGAVKPTRPWQLPYTENEAHMQALATVRLRHAYDHSKPHKYER